MSNAASQPRLEPAVIDRGDVALVDPDAGEPLQAVPRSVPDHRPDNAPLQAPLAALPGPTPLPPPRAPVAAPAAADPSLSLMRAALAEPSFARAAATVATALAAEFACEWVGIGMVGHRFTRLHALSHGAHDGADKALARAIAAAMDEALDQSANVTFPQCPHEVPRITLAHAALAQRHAGHRLLTVPMFDAGEPVGALCFERGSIVPRFDARDVERVQAVAAALAPLLKLKYQGERPWRARWRAGWARRRLWLAAGAAAVTVLLAIPLSYDISTPTRLEGRVQRAVVAPVDGFLKAVLVRPGDTVKAGQLMAELSDEDLRLERQRWETEVARHDHAYGEAQARQDRTQLVIADARAAEARAQLALVDQQLARTQLSAPFDALVIDGDLTQRLGAPVRRGDLVLTLTPTREFRVILELDERDVGQVAPGATGSVALSALPEHRYALVVERVMPVARSDGGRNLFEAEARLVADGAAADALRPGLKGLARLEAGDRPLVWQLSHRLLDWLRLQWWGWVG